MAINLSALRHAAQVLHNTPVAGTFHNSGPLAGKPVYLNANQLVNALMALGFQTRGSYDSDTLNEYVAVLHNGGIPGSDVYTNQTSYQQSKQYRSPVEKVLTALGYPHKYTGNPDSATGKTQVAMDPGFVQQGLGLKVPSISWWKDLTRLAEGALGVALIVVSGYALIK